MHVTFGAVGTFRFESTVEPEQPLKLYPTEILVTTSDEDTLKVIGAPWFVVPVHCPALNDEDVEGTAPD